jgi:hypothetical protein
VFGALDDPPGRQRFFLRKRLMPDRGGPLPKAVR